jgi:ABC-type Mn2+/Zn2+ transport system permease subunit
VRPTAPTWRFTSMAIEYLPLAAVAVTSGLVGGFAVARRMTLAADALSHVALPGIGIAIALHIHPLLGATAMLAFGALLVWGLEATTRQATEVIIGVVFSAALAVGSLITSGEDLIDALFGGAGEPSWFEALSATALALLIAMIVIRARHRLVVALVSPDLARTAGIDVRRLNLLYLEVFALTIALGLRYLGVLLMGSLIIIPAATAKRWSTSFVRLLAFAAAIALLSGLSGALLAAAWHKERGPVVVAVAAALFVLSLGRRPA